MRIRASAAALLLGLAWAPGCKSGPKPPARTAVGAPRADPLASYLGTHRILRQRAGESKVTLKKQELRAGAGGCDLAVQVREARFERGVARFTLIPVGRPGLPGRAVASGCRKVAPLTALAISGFEAGASQGELEAAVGQMLQTPEAYLKAHGRTFDLAPAASQTEAPAHQLTRPAARLMWVEPLHHDPSGRVRHEGEVEFHALVGTDGRLHEARLATALSEEHERRVLGVLPLWRFEPARKGDHRAAARVTERTILRIY